MKLLEDKKPKNGRMVERRKLFDSIWYFK